MLGDLFEERFPPVLALPFTALLASPGHPRLGAVFARRSHLNTSVFQGCGPQCHLVATLQQQLYYIHVNQAQNRLPIHMSDEISCSQTRFLSWASVLNAPDHVVHGVDIAVTHVNADGTQCEAILLARTMDDDGRPQAGATKWRISAWGGVAGRRVGGERAG